MTATLKSLTNLRQFKHMREFQKAITAYIASQMVNREETEDLS
jgi:hypothetical protein